jgi:hypothetical protein
MLREVDAHQPSMPRPGCEGLAGMPEHCARGGAPEGARNGAWRHGERGREAVERLREVMALVSLVRELVREIA